MCLLAASLGMPAQIRFILAMSGRPYPDSLLFQVGFLPLQYCITAHCFVDVVSFLVSKLRFMMKFLYFFSTSPCMFVAFLNSEGFSRMELEVDRSLPFRAKVSDV